MPESSSRRCSERFARGFTLIEVMIAATILAVGLLALAGMQVSAIRGGKQGRHTTEAAAAARSQLEQFDRMNFTSGSLNATGGWVAPTPVSNAGNTVQSTNGTVVEEAYNLQWRITDVDPGNTKSIDVQVTWTDNTNQQQKTLVLSTMKYNTNSE